MSNNNGEFDVTPTESETTGTGGHVSHGSRETPDEKQRGRESLFYDWARGASGERNGSELFRGAAGGEALLLIWSSTTSAG